MKNILSILSILAISTTLTACAQITVPPASAEVPMQPVKIVEEQPTTVVNVNLTKVEEQSQHVPTVTQLPDGSLLIK